MHALQVVHSYSHSTNGAIQPARAVDFTQVKTPDRGLGCNRLFVLIVAAITVSSLHRLA
jgi:hypothetical protein